MRKCGCVQDAAASFESGRFRHLWLIFFTTLTVHVCPIGGPARTLRARVMAIRIPIPGRLLRLFSTAVIDQVLLSGANFFIGFLLIRHTSDADYGLFVLAQSALTLLVSAQGAWLSGPMAVLAPKKSPDRRREMIGALEISQGRFLRVLALLALIVPAVSYLAGIWSGVVALVAATAIIAGWLGLQREYLRSVLLIYSRPHSMLRADMVYVAVLIPGAVFAVFGPKPASVWAVVALAVAAWSGAAVSHRMLARDPGWVRGDAKPLWREMRPLGTWAAVGAVIYWLFSQSYNYILAGRLGLTAVASVNATRLLLMPTIVLTVGVKGLLIPSAAAWLAESGIGKLTRRLLLFIAGIALLDLIYFAFVWIFRDWLVGDLMHKVIADRDLLLILWACISLISLVRDVLQSALLALERFQPLAWLTAAGAIVSLFIMWFGITRWGPVAALMGQMAGEFVNLAGIIFLLRQAQR